MENNDELTGAWVLVHPDLYFDPVAKQGYTGLMTFADAEGDEFYVSFGKDTALYAGDSLMVLQKPQEVYGNLMANMKNLEKHDIKDLYQIGLWQASNQLKDQKAALELASANPNIRAHALITIEDKYSRQVDRAEASEMNNARGR